VRHQVGEHLVVAPRGGKLRHQTLERGRARGAVHVDLLFEVVPLVRERVTSEDLEKAAPAADPVGNRQVDTDPGRSELSGTDQAPELLDLAGDLDA
jgi:hypothetical protein